MCHYLHKNCCQSASFQIYKSHVLNINLVFNLRIYQDCLVVIIMTDWLTLYRNLCIEGLTLVQSKLICIKIHLTYKGIQINHWLLLYKCTVDENISCMCVHYIVQPNTVPVQSVEQSRSLTTYSQKPIQLNKKTVQPDHNSKNLQIGITSVLPLVYFCQKFWTTYQGVPFFSKISWWAKPKLSVTTYTLILRFVLPIHFHFSILSCILYFCIFFSPRRYLAWVSRSYRSFWAALPNSIVICFVFFAYL